MNSEKLYQSSLKVEEDIYNLACRRLDDGDDPLEVIEVYRQLVKGSLKTIKDMTKTLEEEGINEGWI